MKAEAQHLEPVVRVGKNGLSAAVVHSILQALDSHTLIKIRFDQEREEREVLAVKVAEATGATLIWQVGKVAVYYRPKPAADSLTQTDTQTASHTPTIGR